MTQLTTLNKSIASLDDASQAIQGLLLEIKRTVAQLFQYVVQLGELFQWAYEQFSKSGDYQTWVLKQGVSVDTASNYRDVYRNFRDLPLEIVPSIRMRDLYLLAWNTVSQQNRDWYIAQVQKELALNPNNKVSPDLSYIARHAPEIIQERLSNQEINRHQAKGLTDVYRQALHPDIAQITLDLGVQWGEIVSELNRVYVDYLQTSDDKKQDKTWHDIQHNAYTLCWSDASGRDYLVPLAEANRDQFQAYMDSRRYEHVIKNSKPKQMINHFQVKKVGTKTVIEIDDYIGSEIVGIQVILKEDE